MVFDSIKDALRKGEYAEAKSMIEQIKDEKQELLIYNLRFI